MDFIGFDGSSYNLKDFTNLLENYKHYIIVYYNSKNAYCLCFNENIKRTFKSSYETIFSGDTESGGLRILKYNGSAWSLYQLTGLTVSSSHKVIYSCDDLLEYKDSFTRSSFFFEAPKVELATFTLLPIIEPQQNLYKNVFNEVFDILPVLLVCLISFIGVRKAIGFLFSLLRRS